jgi:hypothetical protein
MTKKQKPEGYVFGRPTVYKPEFCQQAIDIMQDGGSKMQVCAAFTISYQTFLNWLDPNHASYQKDFFESIKLGETLSQAWWEGLGKDGTSGVNTDVNATMYGFNMKNRFKEDWRDKQEIVQTTTIVDMTDEDLDAELNKLNGGRDE